ncbi:MAG: hypothetical protein AVDCRST_MAG02-2717, partial [uncultured Rubrobacteraceae bacterium]
GPGHPSCSIRATRPPGRRVHQGARMDTFVLYLRVLCPSVLRRGPPPTV